MNIKILIKARNKKKHHKICLYVKLKEGSNNKKKSECKKM